MCGTVVQSKRSALIQVGKGVYVRNGHLVRSIGLTLRSWLSLPIPLLVGGEHSPWVGASSTLLRSKYSTASQLRAGRNSVSARLTNVEGPRCRASLRRLFLLVRPRVLNKNICRRRANL